MSESLTPELIERLRALLGAVTPLPWIAIIEDDREAYVDAVMDRPESTKGGAALQTGITDADATLIAEAINVLPALLAAVEERDRLRRLREADATERDRLWKCGAGHTVYVEEVEPWNMAKCAVCQLEDAHGISAAAIIRAANAEAERDALRAENAQPEAAVEGYAKYTEVVAQAEIWRHWWLLTHGKSFIAGDTHMEALIALRDAAESSLERAAAALAEEAK